MTMCCSMGNLRVNNFNVPKSNLRFDQEYSAKFIQWHLEYYAK
jgi:hypothetical protein